MAVCSTLGLGPMSEPLLAAGIPVLPAGPRGRVHNYLRPWHLSRVIARFKPDVVHSHGLPVLAELGQLSAFHLAPHWVHTYHFGNYPITEKPWHMHVERLFSAAPDQLVAVSDRQREDLVRFHRLDPQRIMTIPNGVPANSFAGDPAVRQRKRAELGIPPDAFVVGSVAVLSEQKGMTFLLQAAHAMRERHPSVKFLIVGGGPLEQPLREEAAARGLESTVVFTGWRKDAAELLCAFDVYVMASLWEAMPVALLEAMAARLPIVVTDVGQNRQIVEGERSAVVIPPGDASAIVSAVQTLIERPSFAAALAAAAHERVDQQFGTARMIERYEDLYNRNESTHFRQGRLLARAARW
jgi:glycosyltransferase involved in cell wall biosynthesis